MSLRAYAGGGPSQPKQGVEVAGILGLKKLLKAMGDPGGYDTVRQAERRGDDIWGEFKAFRDPLGELAIETPPAFSGRPISGFASPDDVINSESLLSDYLKGSELADTMDGAIGFDDYRIGRVLKETIPGFDAGIQPQKGNAPGVVLFRDDLDNEALRPLVEHEVGTHVMQNKIGDVIGTDPNSAPYQIQHLQETGRLPADFNQLFDDLLDREGYFPAYFKGQRPQLQYLSAMGEAAARASEFRAKNGIEATPPTLEEYLWNPDGRQLAPNMLWSYTGADEAGRADWWRKKFQK